MKKVLLFVPLFIFITISFISKAQPIKASAEVKSVIRDLKGFNSIVAQGYFNLILLQGQEEGVKIETNENIIELFQTRVEDKVLYIDMVSEVRKIKELNVYVSFKDLSAITLLNQVTLTTQALIHLTDINIHISGISSVNMEVYASALSFEVCDGAFVNLKGYSDNLNVQMHDETEFNSYELQALNVKVKASGLSDVMVNAQKTISVFVTGASNVYYTGEPKIISRLFSSTGFIVKRKNVSVQTP